MGQTIAIVNQDEYVLRNHFGVAAPAILAEADRYLQAICPDYVGSFWCFVELSNMGAYVYPVAEGPYWIWVQANQFKGKVSADAAGIICTLRALELWACDVNQVWPLHYLRRLHHYIEQHEEAEAIQTATA